MQQWSLSCKELHPIFLAQFILFLYQFVRVDSESRRRSPKLSFTEWTKYVDEIATAKKLDANEIKGKLAECGAPGTTGATVKK